MKKAPFIPQTDQEKGLPGVKETGRPARDQTAAETLNPQLSTALNNP